MSYLTASFESFWPLQCSCAALTNLYALVGRLLINTPCASTSRLNTSSPRKSSARLPSESGKIGSCPKSVISVGDAVLGPCQNPIEMHAEHTHEFLERLQSRAHGRAHPFLQVVLGPLGLLVVPEHLEGFFEAVSTHDRRVPPHQCRQTFFLVFAETPGILQQQPTAALECLCRLLT